LIIYNFEIALMQQFYYHQ